MENSKGLNWESMQHAVDSLKMSRPDRTLVKIELCKKHWEWLQVGLDIVAKKNKFALSDLFDVKVIVKPYLKKARFYYE